MDCTKMPLLVLPRMFETASQRPDQIFDIEGAQHTGYFLRDQVLNWFFDMGISRRLASPDPIRFSQGVRAFRDLIDQNPRRLSALLSHLTLDPVLTDTAYIQGAVEVVRTRRPHSVGSFFSFSFQAASLVFPSGELPEILGHVALLNELRITSGLAKILRGDDRERLLQWSILAAEFSGVLDPEAFQQDVESLAQICFKRGEHEVSFFLEARAVAVTSTHPRSMEEVIQAWEGVVSLLQALKDDFSRHLVAREKLVVRFKQVQKIIKGALEDLRKDPRFGPFYRGYAVIITKQSEQNLTAKVIEDLRDQVGFLMDFYCETIVMPDEETYFCEKERAVRRHHQDFFKARAHSMV